MYYVRMLPTGPARRQWCAGWACPRGTYNYDQILLQIRYCQQNPTRTIWIPDSVLRGQNFRVFESGSRGLDLTENFILEG